MGKQAGKRIGKVRKEIGRPLPNVWNYSKHGNEDIIAILASDLHISDGPPIARSAESSWYGVMAECFDDLQALQKEHDCPIFYAGDICHKPDLTPETINWAIKNLPKGYSIPGQHDLPLHNSDDIHKSAYWTLVEAKVLYHLEDGVPYKFGWTNDQDFLVTGFGWEAAIQKPRTTTKDKFNLALCHRYVWESGHSHKKASNSDRLQTVLKKTGLGYFDVVAFGDNHQGFILDNYINCGSIMCRHSDQREYRPFVGLLAKDGTLYRGEIAQRHPKWLTEDEVKKREQPQVDMASLIEKFKKLGAEIVDFLDLLVKEARKLPDAQKKILLEEVEKERNRK